MTNEQNRLETLGESSKQVQVEPVSAYQELSLVKKLDSLLTELSNNEQITGDEKVKNYFLERENEEKFLEQVGEKLDELVSNKNIFVEKFWLLFTKFETRSLRRVMEKKN